MITLWCGCSLQPENILICADDDAAKVKIADFGFAKMLDEEQHMLQTACGTPEYVGERPCAICRSLLERVLQLLNLCRGFDRAAPEVLAQTGYDVECDIWSLGVLMYVM